MGPKKGKTSKELQYEIAGRLLLLRVRLFSSASQMARSLAKTPQSWYNYETGRSPLDAETASLIVEVHGDKGVDFNWLYAGRVMKAKTAALTKLLEGEAPVKPARRKQRKRPPRPAPARASVE